MNNQDHNIAGHLSCAGEKEPDDQKQLNLSDLNLKDIIAFEAYSKTSLYFISSPETNHFFPKTIESSGVKAQNINYLSADKRIAIINTQAIPSICLLSNNIWSYIII